MNHDEIKNLAHAAARNIKTEADLNEFRQMLTKITVETALNAEQTAVGFRIRLLDGKPLGKRESAQLRSQIKGFNKHGGGSGKKCTFTADK